ncbi:MAG: cupin domain-containing protein [Planctomycetia bacterium]|nr:cupin domain-containing protein [Planctomycetia bacterium]
MKVERPTWAHSDDRGSIVDILENVPIDSVTIVTVKAGSCRGNHYHKETVQWSYIMEGRVKVLTQTPPGPVEAVVLEAGDLAMTPPHERHAVHAIEDSTILVCTKGPRAGRNYEADTFRLASALVDPGSPTAANAGCASS